MNVRISDVHMTIIKDVHMTIIKDVHMTIIIAYMHGTETILKPNIDYSVSFFFKKPFPTFLVSKIF